MGRSQETFSKKEKEKLKLKKRQDKIQKKVERKANSLGGDLSNMMAYVDEFGNITETPPDPNYKKKNVQLDSIEIGIPKREDAPQKNIYKGRVTHWNASKGYGFIKDLDTQENVFVHVNATVEAIAENDLVSFEIERGPRGLNALNVQKIAD